ncbi:hypothetical protein ACI65C_009345 [Semiaphis heraclei]
MEKFAYVENEVLDKSEEIPENLSQISTNTDIAIDNLCENEVLDKSEEIPENLSQISTNKDDAIDDLCKVKVMNLNVSESMFKKPLPLMLDNYFEYLPLQPVSHTFFNCKKVFYKADGTNRFWLTFDGKSLFCTVCLAFG